MQQDLTVPTDKPQNGLAGRKHWRHARWLGFVGVDDLDAIFAGRCRGLGGTSDQRASCRRSSPVSSCRSWAARM